MHTERDSTLDSRDEHHLHTRIVAEFREMPGLQLTVRQASRLFDIELVQCERVLGTLVEAGALHRRGEAFTRAGSGRRFS
jgi:hypothetical protein